MDGVGMKLKSIGRRGFDFRFRRLENAAAGESGAAIVITMLMLALFTMLGIGASAVSIIEVKTAANDKIFKEGFYLAESAAMEAVQRIENTSGEVLSSGSIPWISTRSGTTIDVASSIWNGSNSSCSSMEGNTRYAAVDQGIAAGSSLGMDESRLHSYTVFG
ncbi:MAG TPA: hypothetical protein ENN79_07730, partial [Desulfobacteraceae bacterium]|nr:hypothetical protein [Desulfobacteraceae bacterium]